MSLVNDMLRDLDKRRAGEAALGNASGLSPAQSAAAQSSTGRRMWGFAVITVAVMFVLAWRIGAGTQRTEIGLVPPIAQPPLVVEVLTPDEPRDAQVQKISAEAQGVEVVSTLESLQDTVPAVAPSVIEPTSAVSASTQISVEEEPDVLDSSEAVAAAPITAAVRETTLPTANELDVLNVQRALGLLADGGEEEAFTLLRGYVQRSPTSHQSRETLIKLLLSRGAHTEAAALADAGLSQVPNHAGFKKAKARALIASANYAEAAALLLARAPQPSMDVEYFELLASAQLAAQDYAGASQIYSQLLQVDRQQARWWYGYAVAQDSLGESSNARQAYTQALRGTTLSANLRRRSEQRLSEL